MAEHEYAGRQVGGRYLLEELVGEGAMGCVYRAKHVPLGRTVAVKLTHSHLSSARQLVRRFTEEARTGAKLNHENIVSVYDFGVDTDDAGRPLFIAMEFLSGPSLDATLPYTVFGAKQIVDIQLQLLAALGHAHVHGVVHRDVSCGNIVLQPAATGEVVKLIDFGVARCDGRETMTDPGQVIGAPHYMAPEQVLGGKATSVSDIYAAGVVLFEMLTGERPFEGETVDAVLQQRLGAPALRPREAAPERDIPVQLSEVCARATAFEPQDRYPSAQAFARALSQAFRHVSSLPPRRDSWQPMNPLLGGAGGNSVETSPLSSVRSPANDSSDFHLLLRLEKRAEQALEQGEGAAATEILLRGARAASSLYNGGQREIGASAVVKFSRRAAALLANDGKRDEAKALLGAALQLLDNREPSRADLLRMMSQLDNQAAVAG